MITRMYKIILICFVCIINFQALGQGKADELQELFYSEALEREARIQNSDQNYLRTFINPRGEKYLLYDIVNSIPLYVKTYNADAARITGLSDLTNSEVMGDFTVTGKGIKIGIWDGGMVLFDHVELIDRVSQRDDSRDVNDHATHVTATILGTGINASAKGMAPAAISYNYYFDNDEAEILQQLSLQDPNFIISNHSYGFEAGWKYNNNGNWQWLGDPSISKNEDYKFGFYDSKARAYDLIAFNYPHFTMVKSAGNHRNDTGDGTYPPDGPFDSMTGASLSKNVITVGAINKSSGNNGFTISDFSSFGPTDDGRVKPDIVAPGVGIFSASSESKTSYKSLGGTSMASPVVAGGIALLQELHLKKHGEYMKSATVKGLIIHTANEAGPSEGPDYQFGWGVFNGKAAADHILNNNTLTHIIQEDTLFNGEENVIEIFPKYNSKISITISWTDKAGNPVQASLDPQDLMLINDMDIRLVDESGMERAFPYVLDPSKPHIKATKGDNFRDNVEKIEYFNLEPRKYQIKVSHKKDLMDNQQAYSILVTYEKNDEQDHLYWIGGSGDFNDPTHWSLSSGGNPAYTIPNEDINVIIDENSFFEDGAVIRLTEDINVGGITWTNKKIGSLDIEEYNLSITNDFYILSTYANIIGNGYIQLSLISKTNVFVSEIPIKPKLKVSSITDSELIFYNDINVTSMSFSSGNFIFLGDTIISEYLFVEDDHENKTNINFNGVAIKTDSLVLMDDIKVINDPGVIIIKGESGYINTLSHLRSPVFLNADSTVIEKAGFNNLSVSNITNFTNSLNIDTINITKGSKVYIDATDTVRVNYMFNPSEDVELTGLGTTSFIELEEHKKYCLENWNVSNTNILGNSSININNGNVVNSEGWFTSTCEELLFADFMSEFKCDQGMTEFISTSQGDISKFLWQIVENGVTRELEGEKVEFSFNEPGIYQVTHLVENENGEDVEYNTEVKIEENTLPDNFIIVNSTSMVSQKAADRYQWYVNDTVIPGATSRTIALNNSVQGQFFVVTYDEQCSKKSEAFDFYVTAVIEEVTMVVDNLVLYPNPSSGLINFESKNNKIEYIEIYNLWGNQIERLDVNNYIFRKDLSLQPGMYFARVKIKNSITDIKFIIK